MNCRQGCDLASVQLSASTDSSNLRVCFTASNSNKCRPFSRKSFSNNCRSNSGRGLSTSHLNHTPQLTTQSASSIYNLHSTVHEPSIVRSSTSIFLRIDFKALSYVWGDSSVTLPILIEDKPYQVTASCHAALRRLRELGESSIWIDAICINQQDDDEKAARLR
jgi:hypothetical protein